MAFELSRLARLLRPSVVAEKRRDEVTVVEKFRRIGRKTGIHCTRMVPVISDEYLYLNVRDDRNAPVGELKLTKFARARCALCQNRLNQQDVCLNFGVINLHMYKLSLEFPSSFHATRMADTIATLHVMLEMRHMHLGMEQYSHDTQAHGNTEADPLHSPHINAMRKYPWKRSEDEVHDDVPY